MFQGVCTQSWECTVVLRAVKLNYSQPLLLFLVSPQASKPLEEKINQSETSTTNDSTAQKRKGSSISKKEKRSCLDS